MHVASNLDSNCCAWEAYADVGIITRSVNHFMKLRHDHLISESFHEAHELPVMRYHIDVIPVLIHTDVYASAHVCRARDRHRTVLSGGPRTLDQSQRHKSASAVSTLPHRSTSDTSAHHAIGAKQAEASMWRVIKIQLLRLGSIRRCGHPHPISESFHEAPA